MSPRLATRANVFGEYVKECRDYYEWTGDALAQRIGVSRPIICDVEKGRRLPALRNAPRWAKALNAPLAYVVQMLLQQYVDEAGLAFSVEVSDP